MGRDRCPGLCEVQEQLLELGADPWAADASGRLPVDYSVDRGDQAGAERLVHAMRGPGAARLRAPGPAELGRCAAAASAAAEQHWEAVAHSLAGLCGGAFELTFAGLTVTFDPATRKAVVRPTVGAAQGGTYESTAGAVVGTSRRGGRGEEGGQNMETEAGA